VGTHVAQLRLRGGDVGGGVPVRAAVLGPGSGRLAAAVVVPRGSGLTPLPHAGAVSSAPLARRAGDATDILIGLGRHRVPLLQMAVMLLLMMLLLLLLLHLLVLLLLLLLVLLLHLLMLLEMLLQLLLDGLHHGGRRGMRVVLHNGLLFLFAVPGT